MRYLDTVFVLRMSEKHNQIEFCRVMSPLNTEKIKIDMDSLRLKEIGKINKSRTLFIPVYLLLHFISIKCLYNRFPIFNVFTKLLL